MKNPDTIRNRTRDLPAYIAVPQPTAPPRAPTKIQIPTHFFFLEDSTLVIIWGGEKNSFPHNLCT